jgi:general secretion pathway protein G
MINTFQSLKRHRGRGEDESGFTLLEILIVIVVLGVLAAVVIFALGGVTAKSAVAACQSDGATLQVSVATFNNQNPGVTVTQSALLSGTVANGNNPYVQSWPSAGPHYAYLISTAVGTPTGATAVGQLDVSVAPAGNVTGSGTYIPYTGPTSCSAAG